MAASSAPRCGHTYLLFVVGELAGLALLLDLVVVHREAGSLVACAPAVFFFYVSVFWRLAFLLLLLLLQDSFCDLSEDEKAKKRGKKKEKRTQRPNSPAAVQPTDLPPLWLHQYEVRMFYFNGRRRGGSQRRVVSCVRSDSPLHAPVKLLRMFLLPR